MRTALMATLACMTWSMASAQKRLPAILLPDQFPRMPA